MRNRFQIALFAMLLAVLLIAIGLPSTLEFKSRPHPEHTHMVVADEDESRSSLVLGLSWLFGVLTYTLFTLCLASGFDPVRLRASSRGLIFIGWLLSIGTLSAIFWTYSTYVDQLHPRAPLGFPVPTAWLLYGLWPTPLVFAWVFHREFDSSFLEATSKGAGES